MSGIRLVRYQDSHKELWNDFVDKSLNGTFMINRNYMDYHAERFQDHSLLVYEDDGLIGVIPACAKNGLYHSHAGISYGGFLIGSKIKSQKMLDIFDVFLAYLRNENFKEILYKPVPQIFHRSCCQYDLYALWRNNFQISRRELAAVVPIGKAKFKSKRVSDYRFAKKSGVVFRPSADYAEFVDMVNERLAQKYDEKSVHTADELALLSSRFPANIKLYGAYRNEQMVGGAVIFETDNTVHTPYLCANKTGRELRVMDFLVYSLIAETYPQFQYFDFGKATEDGGKVLNSALIGMKEKFGGLAYCHDTYSLTL